jgi:general secretion pathway protein J
MQERVNGVATLQTGLAQWDSDLDAVFETGQVSAIDFDGRVLRLTRRDTTASDSPVRVVGWARRVIPEVHSGRGSWARWQSPPLRTRADVQDAWSRVQLWAQNPSDAEKQREVAIVGIDQWQIFFYRNDSWSNPLSATGNSANAVVPPSPASAASEAVTGAIASNVTPQPDGVRLVLTLSGGQPLAGILTRDWVRGVIGGGKS